MFAHLGSYENLHDGQKTREISSTRWGKLCVARRIESLRRVEVRLVPSRDREGVRPVF